MATKYAPLAQHFHTLTGERVTYDFSQIEKILGSPLPRSAREHVPWWGNESNEKRSWARTWQDAGWKSTAVDMANQRVTFERDKEFIR